MGPARIITRQEAKVLGLARYFTGKPCIRGHVSDRTTVDGRCRLCGRVYVRRYTQKNPEKVKSRLEEWRGANREHLQQYDAENKSKNRDRNLRRGREYNRKNAESRNAYAKEYREEHLDHIRARDRKAYHANKEQRTATAAAYRARNAEKVLAAAKLYRKNNPEKHAASQRNREAKKRAAGRHTADDIAEIRKLQRGRCAYCAISLRATIPHVDHIIPIAKNGRNERNNLQVLCYRCNGAKQAKDPIYFARQIGRLI